MDGLVFLLVTLMSVISTPLLYLQDMSRQKCVNALFTVILNPSINNHPMYQSKVNLVPIIGWALKTHYHPIPLNTTCKNSKFSRCINC